MAYSLRADFEINVADADEIAHPAVKGAARWEHDAHAEALVEADRLDAQRVIERIEAEMANLRIATSGGQHVPSDDLTPTEDAAESFRQAARDLIAPASDAGFNELAMAARRAATGMDKPEAAKLRPTNFEATPYVWAEPATIPVRPWVFGHWFLRGAVTALVAPGGVGKSTLISAIALSLCTGRELLDKKVHGGRKRVWLWNLEDPHDEMRRSIQSAAKHFEIRADDIAGRLFVDTAMDGKGLCTATEGGDGLKLLEPVYDAITAEIRNRGIDVLVIDPFISSHEVNENDNPKIDKIVKAWARVANSANCAIVLAHHSSKAGSGEVTVMSARGAKALTDACRATLVINRMDDETASRFGLDDIERKRLIAVHDDKHNRAPAQQADWFRLASVELGNGSGNLSPGDSVGVAAPWSPPALMEGIGDHQVRAVHAAIADGEWRESDQSEDWAGRAVAAALNLNVDNAADKKRAKALLTRWIRDGVLRIVERRDANYKTRKFVEAGNLPPSVTPPLASGG